MTVPTSSLLASLLAVRPAGNDFVLAALVLGGLIPFVGGLYRLVRELFVDAGYRRSSGHGRAALAVFLALPLLISALVCQCAAGTVAVSNAAGLALPVDSVLSVLANARGALLHRLPFGPEPGHPVLAWLVLGLVLQGAFELIRWAFDISRRRDEAQRTHALLEALENRMDTQARPPRSPIRYF